MSATAAPLATVLSEATGAAVEKARAFGARETSRSPLFIKEEADAFIAAITGAEGQAKLAAFGFGAPQ